MKIVKRCGVQDSTSVYQSYIFLDIFARKLNKDERKNVLQFKDLKEAKQKWYFWSRPGSNRGPSACKADVMTTTLQDPFLLKHQNFEKTLSSFRNNKQVEFCAWLIFILLNDDGIWNIYYLSESRIKNFLQNNEI